MRHLGSDYGEKRIGISISDPLGIIAQDLEVIVKNATKNNEIIRLGEIITEYDIDCIVLGFPKNMNNTIGPFGDKVIKFKELLEETFKKTVVLWDERLSSKICEQVLIQAEISRKKRKLVIDKMSAVVILQSYLDCNTGVLAHNHT